MKSFSLGRSLASWFLCASLGAPGLLAQTSWLEVTGPGPAARFHHTLTYDAGRQRTVLFGGTDAGFQFLGDTWERDGPGWLAQSPVRSPTARAFHAMAYDPGRQRVVLFGGLDATFAVVGDTWEWDGTDWQERPVSGPAPTFAAAMAHDDAAQVTLLFGGADAAFVPTSDTWQWDGSAWTQLSPMTVPPPRVRHAMAYDAARRRVVLYGGASGSGPLADTWEWDGVDWTQAAPANSPPALDDHALVYDAARQRLVLFGGSDASATGRGETWEWDGGDWVQRTAPGPVGRIGPAMAYDSTAARIVLFGGRAQAGHLADAWEYGPDDPASAASFGMGCAGTNGTPELRATALAWLGDDYRAQVIGMPTPGTSLGFYIIGFSDVMHLGQPLPLDLGSFGLVGCTLDIDLRSTELFQGMDGIGGHRTFIPAIPSLIGGTFFNQVLLIDPAGSNGMGTTSNALRLTLGAR